VHDLRSAAPDASRLVSGLAPFARAASPAVKSLGRMAHTGRPALVRALPLARDLRSFARDAYPVSHNLERLTTSLDKTGSIKRIMDYLFFQTTAINGYDELGHYLRVAMVVNLCSTYAIDPTLGCGANFGAQVGTSNVARLAPLPKVKPREPSRGNGPRNALPVPPGTERASQRPLREIARRTRERSRGPSPALRDLGQAQPVLDYFLGDE
jgi:phospholipid/cholesterol/gamma-HCH transport system substrate-binding protein